MAKKSLSNRYNWLKNIIALLISAFFFIPFYIILSLSFKTRGDMSSHWIFTMHPHIASYVSALSKGRIGLAIWNTVFVTLISVVLILFFGAIASYPLARYKSRFNKFLLSLFIGVMVVPPLSVLVPIYREMVALHGINTYWGIIALSVTYQLPLSIFMFTNFVSTIPKELDEAALLDGCSQFMLFPRIILPNLMHVISSVAILTGVAIWNDYSFQLYILQRPQLRTITLAISSFFSESMTDLPAAGAATVLSVLPIVIFYLVFQKYFIKGAIDSAIK